MAEMHMSMNMGLRQTQALSAQMIQSLKLLQISTMQLEQMIKQEIEVNPVLEEVLEGEPETELRDEDKPAEEQPETPAAEGETATTPEAETGEGGDSEPVAHEEVDWEAYLNDDQEPSYRRQEIEREDETWQKVPVAETGLEESLLRQLHERQLQPRENEIGEFLIGNIDDEGYLQVTVEEAAERFSVPVPVVEPVLSLIQQFEPPGVGARDLRECLLRQLQRGDVGTELDIRIIKDHFDLFKKLKFAELAKKLDVPQDQVQDAVKRIGSLEPKPGAALSTAPVQTVIPDLMVEKKEGEFVVLLNDRNVPVLRLSPAYADMLRKGSGAAPEVKKFVKEKFNSANWLIKAIEQRKSTMLKVMYSIIKHQPEFFAKGPPHLRPLVLQAVADDIGMHVSTVSRVTNSKYVQTPHGVFLLKYFFSSGVEQDDGTEVSAAQAKNIIQELISAEDGSRPLSDQKLMAMLKERGIVVARRTISKYRDQLNILPARHRKKY